MDNLINQRLDERYLIESLIGSGGMANVYKAKDLLNERTVAVKLLREEFLSNQDLVRRFKNESKAISVLDHPNIVKVYDVSVSQHMQYIVMEYIDGITLKEYMEYRKSPLTYKETVHFVTQALQALQHAHDKGIVHRDVKPQNIMLLSNGTIKMMDFGIARFSRSENQTMTDKAIGSVHYISPEQAKGDTTDAKADIYSVGVMMYEMLSGRLPFESDNAVSVAIKQISDTPTPLREVNPAVPEALETITNRAMAKDSRERYQSAGAMLTDIAAFGRNPSIKFNYQYTSNTAATRYMDKVVSKTPQQRTNQNRTSAPSGAKRAAQPARRGSAQTKTKTQFHYTIPVIAGIAAAFLIGAIILVIIIFQNSSGDLFNQRADVDLPNLYGMTQKEIEDGGYTKQFRIEFTSEYRDDPTIAAGVAFDQLPKPPKKVKEGSLIKVRINQGTQMVTIPNVDGWAQDTAEEELKKMGVKALIKREASDTVDAGLVTRTDPVGGTTVSAGTTVSVYISATVDQLNSVVPNLVGTTVASATQALGDLSLSIGNITEVESSEAAGTIIGQDPAAGSELPIYGIVNVTVSTGIQIRTLGVTVNFDNTVNAGRWSMSMDGVEGGGFDTQDGVAALWAPPFTGSGVHTVIITGPNYNQSVQIDFASGVGPTINIGGTYVAPPASTPTPPVSSSTVPPVTPTPPA